MVSFIAGIIFIAFTIFAVLPSCPLAWGTDVINFLKGSVPVFAALVGIVCIFIGAADIKDKREALKEEREAHEHEKNN